MLHSVLSPAQLVSSCGPCAGTLDSPPTHFSCFLLHALHGFGVSSRMVLVKNGAAWAFPAGGYRQDRVVPASSEGEDCM